MKIQEFIAAVESEKSEFARIGFLKGSKVGYLLINKHKKQNKNPFDRNFTSEDFIELYERAIEIPFIPECSTCNCYANILSQRIVKCDIKKLGVRGHFRDINVCKKFPYLKFIRSISSKYFGWTKQHYEDLHYSLINKKQFLQHLRLNPFLDLQMFLTRTICFYNQRSNKDTPEEDLTHMIHLVGIPS